MTQVIGSRIYSEEAGNSEILNESNFAEKSLPATKDATKQPHSYVYESSITSLSQPVQTAPAPAQQAAAATVTTANSTVSAKLTTDAATANGGWFSSMYSWIGSFFYGTTTADVNVSGIDTVSRMPSSPILAAPDRIQNNKHAAAVEALRMRLAKDLEEINDDQKELDHMDRTANDAEILRAVFLAHMRHRKDKDQSISAHGTALQKLRLNKKELHDKMAEYEDKIYGKEKTSEVLGWVDFGANVVLSGLALYSLATGVGALYGAAVAGSSLTAAAGASFTAAANALTKVYAAEVATLGATVIKAATTTVGAIMTYYTDDLKSKHIPLKQESRDLDSRTHDNLNSIGNLDDEKSSVVKSIKQLLDNHNEAVKDIQTLIKQ